MGRQLTSTNIEIDKHEEELLKIIEYLFISFLENDEEELILHIPLYKPSFNHRVLNSLRVKALKHNLGSKKEVENYEGTCLFDIFNSNHKQKVNVRSNFLSHTRTSHPLQIWEGGVVTQLDNFLPIFIITQVQETLTAKIIEDSFYIFKEMRNEKNLTKPILIDLEKDITLVFNNLREELHPHILEDILVIDNGLSSDEAVEVVGKLENKNIALRLSVSYPYAPQPHSYLKHVGGKRFEMRFHNRYINNGEHGTTSLKIIPQEYLKLPYKFICNYEIFETNHSTNLYQLLQDLKQAWNGLGFNKYTSPFPKYWFLFINQSLTKSEWVEDFKNSYPHVERSPLINRIEEVISELFDLNWIARYLPTLKSDATFVFPEIKGLREKRLAKAYLSFKNYIISLNYHCVETIAQVDTTHEHQVILLNSFDVIDLSNIIQNTHPKNGTYQVVVPDFLHYCYQPWIKYYIFNYQAIAITDETRSLYIVDYQKIAQSIYDDRQELINTIKRDINSYNKKYNPTLVEEIIPPKEDSGEDHILLNDEEQELIVETDKELDIFDLEITTSNKNLVNLKSNERIYQLRNTLILTQAKNLNKGDIFFLSSDLNELSTSKYIDKLNNIPKEVRFYQAKLHELGNSEKLLRLKGISYKHDDSIKNKILPKDEINDDTFIFPRRYSDWQIICDVLSIDSHSMDLAFLAYYGRKAKTKMENVYKQIIQSIIANEWLGSANNPELIKHTQEILLQNKDIFSSIEDVDYSKLSKVFISNIIHELPFREVECIKIHKL